MMKRKVGCHNYTAEYEGDIAREANFNFCYIVKIEHALEALDCQLWPCDGEDCELDDCIHYNTNA